jgi:excisionase family DNA binding protein
VLDLDVGPSDADGRTFDRPAAHAPPPLSARSNPPGRLPDGLPRWLASFITRAQDETELLRDNGAHQAATARTRLIDGLLVAAAEWLDAEIDVAEAARSAGVCEETIRRAIRRGDIPDERPQRRGRHRVRRSDVERFAAGNGPTYDPDADAQDIARLRRRFP